MIIFFVRVLSQRRCEGSKMKITVSFTGPPLVLAEGRPVDFVTKKALALFYYLAVTKRATKAAAELLLWPELDEEHANKNLRNSLYYIGRALGGGLFRKGRGVLEFSEAAELEITADPFGGGFMDGFYLKDAPEFQRFAEDFAKEQSIRLYDGAKADFLEGLRRGSAEMEPLLERYAALSRMNPYDEETARALMERLLAAGDRDALIKIYKQIEGALKEELMIEPVKELQDLYRLALMQKRDETSAAAPYFYGRRAEQQAVYGEIIAFLRGGGGRHVLLSGDVGSGKSCLLQRCLRGCERLTGLRFIRIRCYEAERGGEYRILSLLVGKMLKALELGAAELPERFRRVLAGFFPVISGAAAEGSEASALPFFELEELFAELFSCLTERAKFVVMIDDVRFCDRMSLNFLQRTALAQLPPRALFILVCHQELLGRFVGGFDRSALAGLEIISLDGFRREETSAIVREYLGREDEALAESVWRESDGNPLYLFEILSNIKENKAVTSYKFFYLLENRLSGLSELEQTALRISSHLFGEIVPELVASILGIDGIRTLEIFDALTRNGFLKEERHDGGTRLLFVHERFRSYIYEQQPLVKRRAIHLKIAEAIAAAEERGEGAEEQIDDIIYHYERAGQTFKYLCYKVRKASSVVAVNNDFPEFLTEMTQSYIDRLDAEFAGLSAPLELQYELLLLKASFAIKTCSYKTGLEHIGYLLEYDTDRRRLLTARKQLICYGIQTRNHEMMRENAVEALRLLQSPDDGVERADIMKSLALAEINCGRFEKARGILTKALQLLNGEKPCETVLYNRACIFNYLAYEYKYDGRYERCIPLYKKAVEICTSARITNGLPLFYMNLGQAMMKTGRVAEAKTYFLKFEALREKIYSALSTTIVKAYLALISFKEGDDGRCAKYLREAMECSRVIKNPYEDAYLYKICAHIKRRAAMGSAAAMELGESYAYYYEKAAKNFKATRLEREIGEMEAG